MSVKKVILSLVVLGIFAAFMAVPFSTVEAGERPIPGPTPMDNPPECVPINFPVEGYWGIYCADQDNDIVSATIVTNNNYTLNWDNTYAQFIVELDSDTTELFSSDPTISWSVCDSYGNCVGGTYQ